MKTFLHEQKDLLCLLIPNVVFVWILCMLYQVPQDMTLMLLIFLFCLYSLWTAVRWIHFEDRRTLLEARKLSQVNYTPEQTEMRAVYESLLKEDKEIIDKLRNTVLDTQEYFAFWAHEVKLPISALYLLLENESLSIPELKKQVHRIEQYTTQAMGYVKSTFDENDFRFSRVELKPLIRRVIRSFSAECMARGLSIELEGEGTAVLTDEKWAFFIIEQIFSNAVKYTDDHTVIKILIDESRVEITDQGPGILEEDLNRVFRPGLTGASGHYNPNKSSGMGLYLTRRLCSLLGHTLSISSIPGAGTKAVIDFSEGEILKKS